MAPAAAVPPPSPQSDEGVLGRLRYFALDQRAFWTVASLLLFAEVVLNAAIIRFVPYTEIDWIAYMQEVAGVVKDGVYDYPELRGDTGPLVYPAGFVYVYSLLYYLTDLGTNIRLAQYVFAVLYVVTQALVFGLLAKTKKVPPYALVLLCLSKRLHSIFSLRLFNDPIAMLFLFASTYLLLHRRWISSTLLFSFAVSIKMNILLFAPAFGIIMLASTGFLHTVMMVIVAGSLQLLLGAPFLAVNPWGYMSRSFDLGRQFMYEWTVNWRFLPEDIFLDKRLAFLLLSLHLGILLLFAHVWTRKIGGIPGLVAYATSKNFVPFALSDEAILTMMFTSNIIGISFARSLHYQFYSWYFHSIPYLLLMTDAPFIVRILLGLLIEYAWNVFPSTNLSSGILAASHVVILILRFVYDVRQSYFEKPKSN